MINKIAKSSSSYISFASKSKNNKNVNVQKNEFELKSMNDAYEAVGVKVSSLSELAQRGIVIFPKEKYFSEYREEFEKKHNTNNLNFTGTKNQDDKANELLEQYYKEKLERDSVQVVPEQNYTIEISGGKTILVPSFDEGQGREFGQAISNSFARMEKNKENKQNQEIDDIAKVLESLQTPAAKTKEESSLNHSSSEYSETSTLPSQEEIDELLGSISKYDDESDFEVIYMEDNKDLGAKDESSVPQEDKLPKESSVTITDDIEYIDSCNTLGDFKDYI